LIAGLELGTLRKGTFDGKTPRKSVVSAPYILLFFCRLFQKKEGIVMLNGGTPRTLEFDGDVFHSQVPLLHGFLGLRPYPAFCIVPRPRRYPRPRPVAKARALGLRPEALT
jgi:hypothetical protein